jgi:arsenate reductase-like glutaredoxin family protein
MPQMKDPDFNKYFSGNFSKKEKEELKDWLEKTPQGFNEFLEKRKHYNTQ